VQIVVNHLTRMSGDHICVAGLDPETGQHIRPVTTSAITRAMLKRNGGLFDLAEIVDLGSVTPAGTPPEAEDRRFDPSKARSLGTMLWRDFWALLKARAESTLEDVFGPELERVGRTYATPEGKGSASLGCLLLPAEQAPRLVTSYGLRLTLPAEDAMVAVTDLRSFEADGKTIREPIRDRLNDGMRPGRQVVLAVGLSRPFTKPGDGQSRHWLQVNNVYPAGVYLTEAELR
jgi:hypothetical protein